MSAVERIAAAPISWGVCEVPGWGVQLEPARVLEEMRALGLHATEAGPEGFLPTDPRAAAALLARGDMALVGAFVPAALHLPGGLAPVRRAAALLAEAGARMLVLSATTGEEGYDAAGALDDAGWTALLEGLDAARELCAEAGVRCALHPHAGTLVERREQVERVLEGSAVELCLDTGHLMVGGADPVALARAAADRVAHVHVKDVDAALAARVAGGELPYSEAVRAGIYRPLGDGDVDVAALVALLEGAGYDGWYVLEQDVMLDAEPPAGGGPVVDVRRSAERMRALLSEVAA
ncbi:TIM barrel protein [Conexibacter arvalis]|uniref:Inosose dehydratase n=1 Tax=Conexibacter arvalis TaxID=912552 RepID=A0A840IB07_9ACTN|nr:TIM barrel protein [Conexibacter arvalis]MBB4661535.1 inosose dehydratase [Conexibacter arvalis]